MSGILAMSDRFFLLTLTTALFAVVFGVWVLLPVAAVSGLAGAEIGKLRQAEEDRREADLRARFPVQDPRNPVSPV